MATTLGTTRPGARHTVWMWIAGAILVALVLFFWARRDQDNMGTGNPGVTVEPGSNTEGFERGQDTGTGTTGP